MASLMIKQISSKKAGIPRNSTLLQLFSHYVKNDYSSVKAFQDHENVKVVAEEDVRYETVVAVMDAARGTRTPHGKVTMFPDVSLAGGIIQ